MGVSSNYGEKASFVGRPKRTTKAPTDRNLKFVPRLLHIPPHIEKDLHLPFLNLEPLVTFIA